MATDADLDTLEQHLIAVEENTAQARVILDRMRLDQEPEAPAPEYAGYGDGY